MSKNPYRVAQKAGRIIAQGLGWILVACIVVLGFAIGVTAIGWWFPLAVVGFIAFVSLLCILAGVLGMLLDHIGKKWRQRMFEWDRKNRGR